MSPLGKATLYILLGVVSFILSTNAAVRIRDPRLPPRLSARNLISRQEDNGQFEGHSKGGGPTDGSNGASLNENQLDHYRFNLDDIWYKRWQAIIRENDQLGRGECTTNEGCVSAGLGQQCAICYSSANHDNAKIVKYCSDWNVKEWDFCYANSVCECN